jgi:hypothetical protein
MYQALTVDFVARGGDVFARMDEHGNVPPARWVDFGR